MKIEKIGTEFIQHKSDFIGLAIGKIETFQITHEDGRIEKNTVNFWYDWQTQKLVKVA